MEYLLNTPNSENIDLAKLEKNLIACYMILLREATCLFIILDRSYRYKWMSAMDSTQNTISILNNGYNPSQSMIESILDTTNKTIKSPTDLLHLYSEILTDHFTISDQLKRDYTSKLCYQPIKSSSLSSLHITELRSMRLSNRQSRRLSKVPYIYTFKGHTKPKLSPSPKHLQVIHLCVIYSLAKISKTKTKQISPDTLSKKIVKILNQDGIRIGRTRLRKMLCRFICVSDPTPLSHNEWIYLRSILPNSPKSLIKAINEDYM